MKQGEIWFAHLSPTRDSEQSGHRPVVVISGDTLNDTLPIVIVVLVTSQIKSYPTSVRLKPNRTNGLQEVSEAIPFQVRTITKKRLTKMVGRVSNNELKSIIKGLFVTLTY